MKALLLLEREVEDFLCYGKRCAAHFEPEHAPDRMEAYTLAGTESQKVVTIGLMSFQFVSGMLNSALQIWNRALAKFPWCSWLIVRWVTFFPHGE